MIKDVLVAVLMSVGVFGGGLLLLAALFCAQVRGYNREVATDLLNDWKMQLQLLDADDREPARLAHRPTWWRPWRVCRLPDSSPDGTRSRSRLSTAGNPPKPVGVPVQRQGDDQGSATGRHVQRS